MRHGHLFRDILDPGPCGRMVEHERRRSRGSTAPVLQMNPKKARELSDRLLDEEEAIVGGVYDSGRSVSEEIERVPIIWMTAVSRLAPPQEGWESVDVVLSPHKKRARPERRVRVKSEWAESHKTHCMEDMKKGSPTPFPVFGCLSFPSCDGDQ